MKFLVAYFCIVLFWGCGNSKNKNSSKNINPEDYKEALIEANKASIGVESAQIDAYVKKKKWKVEKTGTGLRYMIYKSGDGIRATTGKHVKVDYSIELLDGRKCYSTEKEGAKEFRVGMDQMESGIHEGITYLREGDYAKIILPSYLAHGLVGDMEKIPAKSTIVYDIHLIEVR